MKHFYTFIIIFIAMPTCKAMENIHKANILAELVITKKPCYAQYLTNDHIVIAGKKGCDILNLITKEEININNLECVRLEVDQNTKKIRPYTATQYDSNTWHSHEATCYSTENINSIEVIGSSTFMMPKIALLERINYNYSYIAAAYENMKPQKTIDKIVSCPNEQLLTILLNYSEKLTDNCFIHHWDTITQNCIHTSSLLYDRYTQRQKSYESVKGVDLSFSPDKTKLLITLDNHKNTNCVIVSVPFIIRKKMRTFIYWCLKNYFNQQALPQDILNLIFTTLFI